VSQAIFDAARQILRRCQRFAAIEPAVIVDGHEIGKRPAYVDRDSHLIYVKKDLSLSPDDCVANNPRGKKPRFPRARELHPELP
jgi:hypothetical protein